MQFRNRVQQENLLRYEPILPPIVNRKIMTPISSPHRSISISKDRITHATSKQNVMLPESSSWTASFSFNLISLLMLSNCSTKSERPAHIRPIGETQISDEMKADFAQQMSTRDVGGNRNVNKTPRAQPEPSATNCLKDDAPDRVTVDPIDRERLKEELKAGRKQCAWRIIADTACKLGDLELANKAYLHLDATGRDYMIHRCKRFDIMVVDGYFKNLSR